MESGKNGTDEPVWRAEMETHVKNRLVDARGGSVGGGDGGINWEIGIDIYSLICIK